MKIYKILLAFCVFISFLATAQENPRRFSMSRLSQDDGLSQGSNYFRHEDQHGFMWITGNDALNRYDGSTVKVYNLKKYFKNCPTLQQGYGFAEDAENLYIGSTRGLYIYHFEQDRFTLLDVFAKIGKDKTAIPFANKDGKIWCFNKKYQIVTYDFRTKKIEFVAQIPIKPINSVHVYESEGNVFYNRIPFFDDENTIWFTEKNEVANYHIHSKKIDFPLQNLGIKGDFTLYSSAFNAKKKCIYLGTQEGILKLDLKEKKSQLISSVQHTSIKWVSGIAVGKDFLALRTTKGIVLTDFEFAKSQFYEKNFERSFCLGFDKAKRLWLCDDGKGQIILDFKDKLLPSSNNLENKWSKQIAILGVSNFAELQDGNIVIQGQLVQNIHDFTFSKLSLSKTPATLTNAIRYFNHWSAKEIWVTQENLNQNSFSLGYYSEDLTYHPILALKDFTLGRFQSFSAVNDKLLISFSKGLYFINREKKTLEKINELPAINAFVINPMSEGRFALSYLNSDMLLAKIDNNGKVKLLQKILPNVQSFYLQEDLKNKKYWVGTNEGVYCLDKNFRIIKKFDSNTGLAGTYIYGILLDDWGNAWCSHQRGLSSIDTKNYRIINYDKNDGIQDWDFNNRGFFKSSKGVLYFGGISGFNYFKPPLKMHSSNKPAIYFDEILVNNQPLPTKNGLNNLSEIQLNYNENDIYIKALIKDLENGTVQKLVYRLNNDNTWKPIPLKNPLILNSLSPGKYKVEFGIVNKFNNTIIANKKLQISISKAYYQSIWFWALLSGLFFGGIFAFYGRYRFLRQEAFFKHELALETQRNKITADLHDDLGATLSSLQINSMIASKLMKNKPDEARKILNQIEKQSQKISENIGDIIWSLKPGKDELMTLTTRIKNFANEILGNTNINFKLDLDESIDHEMTDFTARKNCILIVKEALNNCAKYSQANTISISIIKKEHAFVLEITDDGMGFDVSAKKGNGMGNMQKRAQEIKATFSLKSEKGKTQVLLNIPIIRD